jgi:DNA repair exonuclease SbcCD ATPase subunit
MKFSLRHIYIENFRAIKTVLSLDFTAVTPGLYFVQGINEAEPRLGSNGAGKSSILVDAFYWALTGKIARSQRPGELVENWFNERRLTRVIITFALDDEVHVVERTRNPNNAILDEQKVEQQAIDDLLPLADAALRRSIIIDQFGEMFLSLRPEAQSRIFSETLDLDKWVDASDRASKEALENEKAIITAKLKVSSGEAYLLEATEQLRVAGDNEAGFQARRKERLAEAAQRRAEAALQAGESEKALGLARNAFGTAEGVENKLRLNVLLKENATVSRNIGRWESSYNTSKTLLARLENQIKPYYTSTICPECGQEVTPEHIEEKKQELLTKIDEKHKEIDETIEAQKTIRAELDKIEEEIGQLQESLTEFDRLQQIVAVQAERNQHNLRDLHRVNAEIQQINEEKNPYTDECNRLAKRIDAVDAEVKENKEILDMLNIELEIFKFWNKGFKEIRLEQIDSTLAELEMATNHHAEELGLDGWEIGFATDRELKSGKISHSFSVFLYPPQQKNAIAWESYSGGESQRWQLATTFGLAEVLLARSGVDTDFEVLDEPTTHLSPEGIDDLLACLSNRAKELNRRIFLIDHHSLDRGAFDGVVTVTKTAENGITVDTEITGFIGKRERIRL